MSAAHRHDDLRVCGATTIVSGQGTVFVNGKLWAVEGDENTHMEGGLIATGTTVFVNGKKVIVHTPDRAEADGVGHVDLEDATAEGSGDVFAY